MSDELNLPWKVYFFRSDGKYDKDEVITCNSLEEFTESKIVTKIKDHNKKKLEIRVCDSWDYLIIHWLNGLMVYPVKEKVPEKLYGN